MPSNISLGVSLLVIKMPPVLSKRMVPDQEQTTLVCHNRFKIRFDEIFTRCSLISSNNENEGSFTCT